MKYSSLVLYKIPSVVVVFAFGAGTFLSAQNQGVYAPDEQQPYTQQQPYSQQRPYEQQTPSEPQYALPQQNPAFSPDELRNLVAPIALYPDALLSQILVASSYPQEVVDAGEWMQDHRYLRGRELMMAAQQQNWDPSVQALVAFPDVLARLNADVQWMTDLGNAFIAQQSDVMNAIQDLRAEARERGELRSTPQFQVDTETQGPRTVIEIVPTSPQVIYVPSYDPYVVWGTPVYGAYPALPYAAGCGWGAVFTAVADVAQLLPGFLGWFGPRSWGWALGWLANALFVNNGFFHSFGFHWSGAWGSSVWVHDWHHRLGVPYGRRESVAYWRGRSGFDRAGWHSFADRNQDRRAFAGYLAQARDSYERGRDSGWRSFNGAGERDRTPYRNSTGVRSFSPSRSYGSRPNSAGFAHFPATRSEQPDRNTTANRSWGASRESLGNRNGSYSTRSFNDRSNSARSYSPEPRAGHSSFEQSSRRESSRSFRQPRESRGFSSHQPKAAHYSAPKMPKAPKMAKAHGGGHSSGGHSSKKAHRG